MIYRQPHQASEQPDGNGHRGGRHDQGRDRLRERIPQAGAQRQDAAERDADPCQAGARSREHADASRDCKGDRRDEEIEHELVGLADQVHHELLGPGRLECDDEVTHRDDRAGGPGQHAGKQLGSTQRGGTRSDARDGRGRTARGRGRFGVGSDGHRSC